MPKEKESIKKKLNTSKQGEAPNLLPDYNDLLKARKTKDHRDMVSLVEVVNQWKDPFEPEELIILSCGVKYETNDKNRILNAESIGKDVYQHIKTERVKDHETSVNFYDKIPKVKSEKFCIFKEGQN